MRAGLSFTAVLPLYRTVLAAAAAHHFEVRINSTPTPSLTRDSLYNIYLNGYFKFSSLSIAPILTRRTVSSDVPVNFTMSLYKRFVFNKYSFINYLLYSCGVIFLIGYSPL